jgi:Arc/MetJ-type ribon-helix-helix transcriptional regulator
LDAFRVEQARRDGKIPNRSEVIRQLIAKTFRVVPK